MKMLKKALSIFMAGAFAASLTVMPALATTTGIVTGGSSSATPYRLYTVDVYGGNNGTVNGADPYSVTVPAGTDFSLEGLEIALNESAANRYYVKGIRYASENNAYINSGKFEVTPEGVEDLGGGKYGITAGSLIVNEDTDLVVAYGIKSQRVSYTVKYLDRAGNEIADPDTFVGDIGDVPAPVAKYVEGYIPSVVDYSSIPALKGGENTNVITFDYVKLPSTYTTIYENETIYIVTPEGEQVSVTPVTPEEADAVGGVVPITDATGEAILDADGNPLAAPITEETLDDNENPLANGEAGISTQAQDAASILSWLLPLLAAIVIAGLIMFFALLIRSKRKDNKKSAQ